MFRNNHEFHKLEIFDFEDPFEPLLAIDQRNIFDSSYMQIMSLTPRELRRKVGINYLFEDDGGGIGYFRIWI